MSKIPPKAATSGADAVKLRQLSIDLLQIVLDIAGIVDPTPASDGANAIISLARGNFLDAGLSVISIVPYVGDLAKAGKFPKYLKTVETAINLARESETAAKILTPIMQRVDKALDLLADTGNENIVKLKGQVAEFLNVARASKIAAKLPDISSNFQFFKGFTGNGNLYREIRGRLGIPGKVKTHRSKSAQTKLSGGTGDDAGHLAGNRFGAPGDGENLGLQNYKSNRYGTYKDLEDAWERKLKSGTGIEVRIRDISRPGESRPFMRRAEWAEIHPDGSTTFHKIEFANPHTAKSREMSDIEPTFMGDQEEAILYNLDDYRH